MAHDPKEYQLRALDMFTRWLGALAQASLEIETRINALEQAGLDATGEDRNFPQKAWERMGNSGALPLYKDKFGISAPPEYVARTDEANRPIPHVCFKVPTGGGKTFLAAAALERMSRQTGLILWIMPSKAIYQQTKDALRSREHPYRQMLDWASGERVKLLEKETSFTALDVANYLCVMLLMLPAANRQKGKEFLRMFRDSGRYPSFFPERDDKEGGQALLDARPDLERAAPGGPVLHSLFNVFKMQQPVVVLDEAHKAYGSSDNANREFVQSINRLDPRMVIELSATPHHHISNLLVDIRGADLKAEQMIKLPVQIASPSGYSVPLSAPSIDWHPALEAAAQKLEDLTREAQSLQHDESRYIRPIAVVRVERTGKDQQDGDHVHAEDVRAYLATTLGVPNDAIRVKSSEKDEIRGEDLLSPYSPVQWIITKAALMEGWDCSFAYLLVMLDNTQAQRALTQLVGRVMRMPDAQRTGREALDQCYVYCWNADVGEVVKQVKGGLEREGLEDLLDDVRGHSQTQDTQNRLVERRNGFRNEEIFLPKVLHAEEGDWRGLDYERHILPEIAWRNINAPDMQSVQPRPIEMQWASVDLGEARPEYGSQELAIDKTLSVSWFARRLADIMPNPWQAARVTKEMIDLLRAHGMDEAAIYDARSYYAFVLKEHVIRASDKQAENIFQQKLQGGEIKFDLEVDSPRYRLYENYNIDVPDTYHTLERRPGDPLQLSLFIPMFEEEFGTDLERRFARYLDEQTALRWWHRVAARQRGGYYLRGWRQERIYPDFIAMAGDVSGKHLLVLETKGEHLAGNDDTEYKASLLEALQGAFNEWGKMKIHNGPAKGTFRLVFDGRFDEVLADVEG